jgi:hypothetical protein
MTAPLAAFLLKLPLALLVFLLIAYAGTASKRIAGVLFTFPILNGIAIIASHEPVVVADAIYPLVIFNCVLFAALITFPQALPPVAALPRWGRLSARVLVWSLAWLAGAAAITNVREQIFGGGTLLAGSALFALAFMWFCWSGTSDKTPTPRNHPTRFVAFWSTTTGFWRIAFFVVTYACLFWASRAAADQKWVGMASALPLPGFFALATLIDDAETRGAAMTELRPIRDTLFLGPVLVIPFNWTFSQLLASALPSEASTARYLVLFAMWAIAALVVIRLVPRLAAALDAR